jgi:hypothetical protein
MVSQTKTVRENWSNLEYVSFQLSLCIGAQVPQLFFLITKAAFI